MAKAPRNPDTPRARPPERWDDFIAYIRENGPNVKAACAHIGVARQSAYERRESHPDFAKAWDDAIEGAVDTLAGAAFERASKGWKPGPCEACDGEGLLDGEDCLTCNGTGRDSTRDRPSDDLTKFLLKSHRPDLYGTSIRIKGSLTLGELRSLSDEEMDEIARRNGLIPEE